MTFIDDFGLSKPTNIFERLRNDVIKKHESWDIFIAQKRGAGKSTVALRLATLLNPNFTLDYCVFTLKEFMKLLTSPQPLGTVIMFDDLGTQKGGSSRRWQTKDSHDVADIMQLNRTDGIITIATSLELERGEKRLRAGFQILIDPGKKLSSKETGGHGLASRIILRTRLTDVYDGTTHWPYMRYTKGGRITAIEISHPSKELWNSYQQKRASYLKTVKSKDEEEPLPEPTKTTHTKAIVKEKKDVDIAYHLQIRGKKMFMQYRAFMKGIYDSKCVDSEHAITAPVFRTQLERELEISPSTSSKKVTALKEAKLIDWNYTQTSVGGPRNIWLTKKGIEFALNR